VTDFDPETDAVGTTNTQLSFFDGDVNSYKIDPNITVIDGIYYLAIGGNYIYSSNNYLGPYQRFPTNFAPAPQKFGAINSNITNWVEGPELIVDGDSVRIFADQAEGNGLVFRSAVKGDYFNWSDVTKTHAQFKMRHGSILVNEKVTSQVDAESDGSPKFSSKITIKAVHGDDSEVPLTCFMKNSFQLQYENNQTNQIQFVAYDDGSPSFQMISNEATISFNNDLYIIKNIEQEMTGSSLYTVTAMQYVNSEINRVFQRNIKNGTLTYTINDVLDFFLNDKNANPFGFSYHVFGDFDKQQIENLGGCSGKDMISKIVETWPGTIVYPNKKRVDVYSADSFKKNYGRRLVYIYNTSNIKLTEDSTGIVNQVKCIGATIDNSGTADSNDNSHLSQTVTQQVIQSGTDHTADFQADAKKYLGVPYVWGGAGGSRGGNPFSGMDCSSYVSQVYKDFGINIPAYTVAMESSFREIPYSEVKPGDVGFYGPHGATHHICLMLDHNTMIYEPEPGESCKTAPVNSYAPSWYGRNDAMQAKINTKKDEVVDNLHLNYVDNYSGSTADTGTAQYYFQPFIISDQNSIDQWGLHPGADVQDDRFKDANSMKAYARKQLVTDPTITVEVTEDGNRMPIPGEVRPLTIPNRKILLGEENTQSSYNTEVTTVAYIWYPFDKTQGVDVTYDNLQASILHARTAMNSDLRRIEQLANAALDRMPQVFYTTEDPSANQTTRNGAIWINPIHSEEVNHNGGSTDKSDSGNTTHSAAT
ncbi:phage tail protein, partial [Limosilactobacillus vaginalis]|uniref:phage tail protein n=1 Tax=Limosilactobacillus vaginalis TaxID=1633 RepID=UPI001DEA8544